MQHFYVMSYKQLDAQGSVQESIRIPCHKQSWHFWVLVWNLNSANYLQSWTYKLSEWCIRRKISSCDLKSLFHFFQFLFFFFCFYLQFLFENLIHINAKLLNFTKWTLRNLQSTTWEFFISHTVAVYLVKPQLLSRPRLSGFFDCPDLLLWCQFFMKIKRDSVQSSSNTCKNYLLKIYSQHGNFLNAI